MSCWIVSRRADLAAFVLPVFLALFIRLVTSSYSEDYCPFYWAFLLETMVDCAHVYATLYRTVLDSEACALNWRLYLIAAPGLFTLSVIINVVGGHQLGWSLLAYYAWFHFAKQPFGFICLYKARIGERDEHDHRWDYWTCMGGAGFPFLLWHTGEFPGFRWFSITDGDDKIFVLPDMYRLPLWVFYILLPTLWFSRNCYKYLLHGLPINIGKNWIMAVHYFTWYMGMTTTLVHNMAFINLFHGLSSLIIVFYVVQQRYHWWRKTKDSSTMQRRDRFCEALVSSPWGYCFIVALASAEASLWDITIDREMAPRLGLRLPDLTHVQGAIVTSVLQTPQLAHYFLDGYIWRMTGRNPGLKDALLRPA